ncbi:DUF2975 domain-containing protein [Erythrobacter alti]|uniref:DUF2975 domain-containing protein n=1 Tax=Erythrobacter alti TaxID=1896145 RepID=UPI0030F3B938
MDNTKGADPLLLAGKVLTIIMQIAMGIGALALLIGIPALFIFQSDIAAELASEVGEQAADFPLLTVAALMGMAVIAVGLIFMFFDRLRKIIGTVGEGDPFAPANARRLNAMAWLLLGVQVIAIPMAGLGLTLAKWADETGHEGITIDAGLDLTGILMVVVLFILARVFRIGAAMRDDLEGTV